MAFTDSSPANKLWQRAFRFLVPILLGLLLLLLSWLNRQVRMLPEFSLTVVYTVVVAPLAELYYIWQRPTHFRYPLLLTFGFLALHGGLGMNVWLVKKGLRATPLLAGYQLGNLVSALIAGAGLWLLVVYWLRSVHKRPRRGVDWLKLLLMHVLCLPLVAPILMELGWVSFPAKDVRMTTVVMLGGGSIVLLAVHVIEEIFSPPKAPVDSYELLLDELSSKIQEDPKG